MGPMQCPALAASVAHGLSVLAFFEGATVVMLDGLLGVPGQSVVGRAWAPRGRGRADRRDSRRGCGRRMLDKVVLVS
jgi:hypothetical protein